MESRKISDSNELKQERNQSSMEDSLKNNLNDGTDDETEAFIEKLNNKIKDSNENLEGFVSLVQERESQEKEFLLKSKYILYYFFNTIDFLLRLLL